MRIHGMIRTVTIAAALVLSAGWARTAFAECWSTQWPEYLETYCQTCGQSGCCWGHWHDDIMIDHGCNEY